MTDQRAMERIIAHLRTHVADLRRLQEQGAKPQDIEERKRLIARLQNHLASAVRDLLEKQRPSPV